MMFDSRTSEMRTIRGLVLTLVVVGGLLALWPSRSEAATTFTVNRTADTEDANFSNAVCDVNPIASGNQCTLRAAIQEANDTSGADAIRFAIGGTTDPKTINVGSSCVCALPPITGAVTINGYSQGTKTLTKTDDARPNTLAQGNNARLRIQLNGLNAGLGSDGLVIAGANSTIKGLTINRFHGYGIRLEGRGATGNRVEGNFIGTDVSGSADLGNIFGGVLVAANNNTIGGTQPAQRNLISGNDGDGVSVYYATDATIQGNYVGTNADGTESLGNRDDGVNTFMTNRVMIGGTVRGARNLISGNSVNRYAVFVGSADDPHAEGAVVQGNYVGTKADGTGDLTNDLGGVFITTSAPNNTIGGSGAGNKISGIDGWGILVGSNGNKVVGNSIHGNSLIGVEIGFNASNNLIGGMTPAEGNRIYSNGDEGVVAYNGTGNSILSNSIYRNGGLGIDLGSTTTNTNGVTENDGDDPATQQVDPDSDIGANDLQNFPVVTSAVRNSTTGSTTITGTLNSNPDGNYTIQCFRTESGGDSSNHGEGRTLLDTTTTATNADGDSLPFTCTDSGTLAVGDQVSVTATNEVTGDTSEFSLNLGVTSSP